MPVVKLPAFIPNLAVVLSLFWPSTSPALVISGWSILFLLGAASLAVNRLMVDAYVFLVSFILLFFGLSCLHFVVSGSFDEFYDLARLLPVFTAFMLRNYISLSMLNRLFLLVGLTNLLAVLAVEYDFFRDVIEILYARSFKNSYGRHSGIFLNVSTLGLFGLLSAVFSLVSLAYIRVRFTYVINFLISLSLIIASGGKTQLLVLVLILPLVPALYMRKAFLGYIWLFAFLLSVLTLHLYGVIYIHSLQKLINGVFYGLDALSSVGGRFDIWNSFYRLWSSSLYYMLFGVPVTSLDNLGNTFDSDPFWFIFRYGLIGFVAAYSVLAVALWSGFRCRNLFALPLLALVIASLSVGVSLAFQMSLIFWLIVFKSLHTKNRLN